MTLTTFNITELGVFTTLVLGSVALIIKQTQKSRCRTFSCLWGLFQCERDLITEETLSIEESV